MSYRIESEEIHMADECTCFYEHGVGKRRTDPDCPIHGDGGSNGN